MTTSRRRFIQALAAAVTGRPVVKELASTSRAYVAMDVGTEPAKTGIAICHNSVYDIARAIQPTTAEEADQLRYKLADLYQVPVKYFRGDVVGVCDNGNNS